MFGLKPIFNLFYAFNTKLMENRYNLAQEEELPLVKQLRQRILELEKSEHLLKLEVQELKALVVLQR